MSDRPTISRAGEVLQPNAAGVVCRRGWVDRYRPVSSRLAWRGVREGGHEKRGFQTRKQAAEWVVNGND